MRAERQELAVREGIEPSELARISREHPELHAVARWDLANHPDSVTFYSLRKKGRLVSYLLLWRKDPKHPVVH
ncbi:MAG TPA: hypothetical protein VFF67_01065 [Thermoplasmata archaeon]|nr:hypothetical protein [Thermoplasmata archaeon]